jgi:hypothetical protein
MLPVELLRLGRQEPDEDTLEMLEYHPETPFAIAQTAKETSPEVWADYFTLVVVMVSGLLCVTLFLAGG